MLASLPEYLLALLLAPACWPACLLACSCACVGVFACLIDCMLALAGGIAHVCVLLLLCVLAKFFWSVATDKLARIFRASFSPLALVLGTALLWCSVDTGAGTRTPCRPPY